MKIVGKHYRIVECACGEMQVKVKAPTVSEALFRFLNAHGRKSSSLKMLGYTFVGVWELQPDDPDDKKTVRIGYYRVEPTMSYTFFRTEEPKAPVDEAKYTRPPEPCHFCGDTRCTHGHRLCGER